jgi:A/G-specific adenine glycosylase
MAVMTPDRAVTRLVCWFADAGADLPWRRTRDRYAILVSEVMLQATQVARVERYYTRWIERWPTPAALAATPLGEVLAVWQGLGYPRRARNLWTAAALIARDGWPEDLRTLPGVGAYTAAAVSCFADEAKVIPVDVNVERVMARRWPGGWPGTPPGGSWAVGQALMDLGRTICTAKAPACDTGCPLRSGCPAADLGRVAEVTPAGRRQGRYAGSMRQRRGRLLAAIASEGRVELALDPEAAQSLIAEGLARRGRRYLLPAG